MLPMHGQSAGRGTDAALRGSGWTEVLPAPTQRPAETIEKGAAPDLTLMVCMHVYMHA